jgi:hypothetical protein
MKKERCMTSSISRCTMVVLGTLCLFVVGDRSVLAQYQVYWGDVHGHSAMSD